MTDETTYAFRFNLEGGKHIEFDLSKERFEKLSELCDKHFPDKNWKTDKLVCLEA